MVPDVLGSSPPRRPPSARRRRLLAGGLAAAVAAGAFVLASRSEPAPEARPAPAPAPATATTPGRWVSGPVVLDTAANAVWTYALTGTCRNEGCRYRLYRRDTAVDPPEWAQLTRLPSPPDVDGLSGELVASGDGTVAVVERTSARAWVSEDGGINFRPVAVRPGPATPTAPPQLTARLGACAGCEGLVTVLDPVTGSLRRLATQPPVPPPARAFADGGVLWAAAPAGRTVAVAASADRGRTWTTSRVPAAASPDPGSVLLAADGGTAYLTVDGAGGTQVWKAAAAGGPWRRLPAEAPLRAVVDAAVVNGRLLLCADGRMHVERGGALRPVRPPQGRELPVVGRLATAGTLVVARPAYVPASVLTSSDGSAWTLETLPR